jgi:hypothetical protein
VKEIKMKRGPQLFLFFGSLMMLLLLDAPALVPVPADFVGEANAIIGRPLTPLSYAGVARRTSRRIVRRNVAYSSAAATYTTAPAPAPTQPAPPPANRPAGAPPIGTVVNQLPAGCVSSPRGGVEYYNCNGVFYRPVAQGNNLVYMVENPG